MPESIVLQAPINTLSPITTLLPITAFASIVTLSPNIALDAITALLWILPVGLGDLSNNSIIWAKAIYGFDKITALVLQNSKASSVMSTADALVSESCFKYLGLVQKEISPSPACDSVATFVISIALSPLTVPSNFDAKNSKLYII